MFLTIPLDCRQDSNKANFYVGKLETTGTLRFRAGTVIFGLTSEEGTEELRIGKAREGSVCTPILRSYHNDGSVKRYHIKLEARESSTDGTYYMALIQDEELELDLEDGWAFLLFTSKPGCEELQIAPLLHQEKGGNREVRVERRRSHSSTETRAHKSGEYALALPTARRIL